AVPPDSRIAKGDSAGALGAAGAVMVPEPDVVAPDVVVPDVVPPDVVVPDVVVPDVVPPDVVVPDVVVPDVVPSDVVAPDVVPPDVVPRNVVADLVVPPARVPSPEVLAPPEVVRTPRPAAPTYPRLLAADWEERLGARPPRVAVDEGMWQAVLAALGRRRAEVGGVALTVRVPGTLIVLGLVLPQQVHASGVFCEFRSEEVIRVRDVIDSVTDILDLDPRDVKITWVHTHPGMGPFLSGTDQATTSTWRALDPDFTPIVLDPLAQRLSKQIGVFDTDNRKIDALRVVEGLADRDAVGLLKNELIDAYREAKGTMVLFGAD
ncbi:MAG TPA: hypothetical protein VMU95_33350, partial [Trebonia sp.]|nr:hypothetical protein [Trebonia sp.]